MFDSSDFFGPVHKNSELQDNDYMREDSLVGRSVIIIEHSFHDEHEEIGDVL